MPIIDLLRQKLTTTNALPLTLNAVTPVEIDTGSEDSTLIKWKLPSTDPAAFTVVSSAANASTTLTTAISEGFSAVRVGDVVSGTGIAGGSTVTAKASNTSLTLSAVTTAQITAGTITFDPPAIVPTVLSVKVSFTRDSANPTVMNVSLFFYTYNGSLLGADGTDLNATKVIPLVTDVANGSLGQIPIDMEAFYTAIRVGRTA